MNEKKFQAKITKYIKNSGGIVLNVHGHMMQAAGWPDLYVAYQGVSVWIELKVGRNWLSTIQEWRMKQIIKCSIPAFVLALVDDMIEVRDVNRDLLHEVPLKRLDLLKEIILAKPFGYGPNGL